MTTALRLLSIVGITIVVWATWQFAFWLAHKWRNEEERR